MPSAIAVYLNPNDPNPEHHVNWDDVEARKNALQQIAALNRDEFLRHSPRYQRAIRSRDWHHRRRLRLELDKFTCMCCGVKRATEVHHKDYRFGVLAPLDHLMSVCRECHQRLHTGWWGYLPEPANDRPAEDFRDSGAANDNYSPEQLEFVWEWNKEEFG